MFPFVNVLELQVVFGGGADVWQTDQLRQVFVTGDELFDGSEEYVNELG